VIGVVDIGGTKLAVAVVDENGRLHGRAEEPTLPERGFERAVERIVGMLHSARGAASLTGIGVGSTGPISRTTGIYGQVDVLPGWQGEDLKSALAAAFAVPVEIENDAAAAALGEAHAGAGRGVARFLYVTISTGIGGALVIDGALYRGASGAHPEIGHHVIEASGPPCPCGERGCWEVLASGPALACFAKNDAPASLRAGLSAETVCAHATEDWARAAIDRTTHYLAIGISNLQVMFAPDVIALGGGVMKSATLFLDRIRDRVGRSATLVPRASIVVAECGADAVLLGAARALLENKHA
jgi:glucokinase